MFPVRKGGATNLKVGGRWMHWKVSGWGGGVNTVKHWNCKKKSGGEQDPPAPLVAPPIPILYALFAGYLSIIKYSKPKPRKIVDGFIWAQAVATAQQDTAARNLV